MTTVPTAIETLAPAVQAFVDPVAAAIQTIFDTVALRLQAIGALLVAVGFGAFRAAVEPLFDAFAALVEALVDAVAAVVQASFDAVAVVQGHRGTGREQGEQQGNADQGLHGGVLLRSGGWGVQACGEGNVRVRDRLTACSCRRSKVHRRPAPVVS